MIIALNESWLNDINNLVGVTVLQLFAIPLKSELLSELSIIFIFLAKACKSTAKTKHMSFTCD